MAKIEIFQFCREYSATTLRLKNSVEIALSLTISEILIFFVFSQKFKMAAKSGEKWNFSILYRILCYYPMGKKFCRNRSISYGFWDINIFCFSQKFKMAAKSGENWIFSISHRILCYNPTGKKFCRNRFVSYGFQDINIFLFFRKNSRWPPKVAKIETFQFCIEYFLLP